MASTSEATRRHCREMHKLSIAVRGGHAEIKQLVAAGELTVAEALFDERAQGMKIGHLLCAQHGWGVTKAQQLLGRHSIWPTRQVRQLTERQRQLIAEALSPTTENA